MKQGDALSPLLFNCDLEYAIRRVQVSQDGLKLNGTHQLLVYADVNILGGSVHTIKKNTDTLLVGGKEIGLEVNANKPKYEYMVIFRDQNAGLSHNIKIHNSSFEMAEEFKYLGKTVNLYSIQEEIKTKVKPGNACYYSVHNLFVFQLAIQKFKD